MVLTSFESGAARRSPFRHGLLWTSPRRIRRPAWLAISVVTGLLVLGMAAPGAYAATVQARAVPQITIHNGPNFTGLPAPISTTDCQSVYGISCYTPTQLRTAYDMNPLYRQGINGTGRTIVVATPFGSPTISNDIEVFDARFGLPDPDLQAIQFGSIPPYDPQDLTMVEWAAATTFQVEYAHAIAPDAKIVIAETPVDETVGVTGFPELMQAEKSLIDSGVGDVILQVEGAAENTFPGFSQGNYASLLNLRYAYTDALAHHVTVLAAAGNTGVANSDGTNVYPYPTVRWPSSDPLVTSVGGSQLYLDNAGDRLQLAGNSSTEPARPRRCSQASSR